MGNLFQTTQEQLEENVSKLQVFVIRCELESDKLLHEAELRKDRAREDSLNGNRQRAINNLLACISNRKLAAKWTRRGDSIQLMADRLMESAAIDEYTTLIREVNVIMESVGIIGNPYRVDQALKGVAHKLGLINAANETALDLIDSTDVALSNQQTDKNNATAAADLEEANKLLEEIQQQNSKDMMIGGDSSDGGSDYADLLSRMHELKNSDMISLPDIDNVLHHRHHNNNKKQTIGGGHKNNNGNGGGGGDDVTNTKINYKIINNN